MQNQKKKQRRRYPTDLTSKQWEMIKPLIPKPKSGGRPRKVDEKEILNACFYVLRTGCSWRMLPHDFPPHKTVYHYFTQWKNDGTWKRIHDTLRSNVRRSVGKKSQPTAGIIDSQSVKTTEKGGFVAMMPGRR